MFVILLELIIYDIIILFYVKLLIFPLEFKGLLFKIQSPAILKQFMFALSIKFDLSLLFALKQEFLIAIHYYF
jgi:hypothetical protein